MNFAQTITTTFTFADHFVDVNKMVPIMLADHFPDVGKMVFNCIVVKNILFLFPF